MFNIEFWQSTKRDMIIMMLILITSCWLRFQGIDAKSLWVDEGLSWQLSRFDFDDIIARTGEQHTTHPPLYFLCLKLWTMLWGTSEAGVRSLAAFGGILTIIGVYFFTRQLLLLDRLTGMPGKTSAPLLAAFLIGLSVLHIHASQQIRHYSLSSALSLAVYIAFLNALRSGNKRWWITGSVAALLFCYTHHLAIIHLGALLLFIAVYLGAQWRHERAQAIGMQWASGQPSAAKQVRLAILSFSLVLLGYSFWLSHLFGQISAQSHSNRFFPLPHLKSIVGTSFNTLTSTFAKDTIAPVWFTAVITLFLLFLLLYLAMLSSWAGKFLCLTGLLPPLVLLFQSFYTGRGLYTVRLLTSTQLIWVVALAYAISLCSNLMHRRVLIISAVACAVTFCVLNWSTIGPSAKPGVKGAVSHILANRSEDEPILTRTEFVFFAAHYYAYACTNVQLCSKERSRFAFSFSAHLRNEDLITIDEVRKLKCRGVWFISSKSYNSMSQLYFEVPQHWKRDINLEFSQGDYSWEVHPVTVEHYVIDNSPRE